MRALLRRTAGVGAVLAIAAIAGGVWLNGDAGADWLARRLSASASSPDFGVSIAAIEHPLSSQIVVRDIALSDAQGVWLRIDRVALDWSPLSLVRRVAQVDGLRLGHVEILRKPAPSSQPAPAPAAKSSPLIPDLPVSLRLHGLAIDRLNLAEPVAGVAASFAANGDADLGGGGAAAKLMLHRLDAAGEVAIDATVAPKFADSHINLRVAEPAGGLIARLAAIPGLPPVAVDVNGGGGLDDFTAQLTATAGSRVSAKGEARIARDGAARNVALNLESTFAAFLPPSAAALFPAATRLAGHARVGDDGAIDVNDLSIVSDALKLDAHGTLAANGALDVTGGLHQAPPRAGAAFHAKALDATFHVGGALTRPEASVNALGEDIVSPAGQFGRFELAARVGAPADNKAPDDRIDIVLDAAGTRLAFADRMLADLIGEDVKASVRARAALDGEMDVGVARLGLRAGEASFAGKAGPHNLAGRLTLASPDLSTLSHLSGHALRGALNLVGDLSGAPADGRIAATLSGGVTGPAAGIAAVDGLLGRKLTLSGKATVADGSVTFDNVALTADHLALGAEGVVAPANSNLKAHVDMPDLHAADDRFTGRARVDAALTGPLDHANATFALGVEDASANGRKIPRLALTGDAADVTGALKANVKLDGVIDGKPARGQLALARANDALAVDGLDVAIGRATLKGAVKLATSGLASGRITLAAPDLDDFSALALRKLAGRLDADVTLETADGAQNATIAASGAGVHAPEASVDRFTARFSARDALRRPALDGEIAVDNAKVGAELVSSLRLTAKPAGAGAALDLSVAARGYNVQGHGVLTPGERSRLELASLVARRGAQQVGLAGPASIAFGGGDIDIKGLSVALGSGRFDVDGTVGKSLDLTARMRAIPLSIAALVDPTLKLDGMLDGEARIGGATDAPTGDWKLHVSKFSAPQTRSNGAAPIDVAASGRLGAARTSIESEIAMGPKSRIGVQGSAPLSAEGALDLAVKGVLDAALANTVLAASGQSVKGRSNLDLRVTGPATAPIINGNVTVAEGGFDDPLNGVSVRNISARLEARGREMEVASFTAETRNGGKIGLTGKVALTPDNGFPGAFHVTTRNAQLANSDTVSSTADVDLDISGALARAPRVSGKVTLLQMDVAVPDRMPANLKPIPGTTHIDARGFAKQMLDLEKQQKQKEAAAAAHKSAFDAAVDLTIAAPNKIFVRGRGIDAEFGGELKLAGTIQKPSIVGGFDLRRGKLDMLTQRVNMTAGKLTFVGGLMPELDFTAQTAAGDVTATVNVTGPANAPQFAFSSSPALPQDEVMARLLFNKAAASLSPIQAVQLATAIAQFSGASSGVGAFEKMRRALGVDSLDVDATGPNGPKVGASRYLTNNISVGVKTGTKPEESSVNVGIDLFKGVRAQGETSMDGKSSVGVGVEFEY